jgi:hypothetical protein
MFILGLLGFLALPALSQPAGRIDLVDGEVRIVDANAKPRSLLVGEAVHQGDTVTTGKDGEIHLKMNDGGILALRPDARMTIVRFQNTGKASDSSLLSLARGALRAITGWIGRRSPDHVRIQTPTATIGIRGTDHEALVIPEDSSNGEPGTYDKVNAGGTTLKNQRGVADVSPGQAAFASPTKAPEVLPSVPEVFKPARNDGRLEGLHESIQRSQDPRAGVPPPQTAKPATPATAATPNAQAAQSAKAANVQIQGNTTINAVSKDATAIAVGQGNEASNQIGTIGGK